MDEQEERRRGPGPVEGEALVLVAIVTEGEEQQPMDFDQQQNEGTSESVSWAAGHRLPMGESNIDDVFSTGGAWAESSKLGKADDFIGSGSSVDSMKNRHRWLYEEQTRGAGGGKRKAERGREGSRHSGGHELEQEDDYSLRSACLARLESAAGLGFDELRRRHAQDVAELFGRVEFSLGDDDDGDGDDELDLEFSEKQKGNDGARARVGAGVGARHKERQRRQARDSVVCGSVGLPIRTRVARSGKACTGWVQGTGAGEMDEEVGAEIVDDGLIELMYHYGR